MFILNSKIRGNQALLQSLLVFFYLELKCDMLLNYGLLALKNGVTFCRKMPVQYILILYSVIFLRCRWKERGSEKASQGIFEMTAQFWLG